MGMLKQHLAGRQSGLVFLSRIKTTLRNTTVLHKHLHPLLRKLGFESGGMHAFRHFRVSYLVEHGTPLELVKRWIGHGSEQMTRRYTHLRPEYARRALEQVPAVIAPFAPETAVA
jgi:site-specific recombinase XerD